MPQKKLIAIIEQGGYPDYKSVYTACGYEVETIHSMRKAMLQIKKTLPQAIVAEFNYQSDFRDRTSNLESLLATVEQVSHRCKDGPIKVIVFYEVEYRPQLEKLKAAFSNFEPLAFPIDQTRLLALLA